MCITIFQEKGQLLTKKRPVFNKLESMKAAEKLKKVQAEKKKVDTDSDSSLRRSSRLKEEKDDSSDKKWTKFREKKSENFKSPSRKKSPRPLDNSLIIIDDDDEPTDGEFGTEEEPTDTENFDNDEESTDIDFGTDEIEAKEAEEPSFKGKIDASNKDKDETEKEKEPENSGKSSGSSDSKAISSVPQNVLGAIDFFQSLSSKSGGMSKDVLSGETVKTSGESSGLDEKPSRDNEPNVESKIDNTKDDTEGQEKEVSEPLQSWTQKLNELNSSPRPMSPARKWASQGTTVTAEKKSKSSKSIKKVKKKPADENEEKGALDKWIVRSPTKGFQGLLNTDIVVANLSQTLVEETQSPTKFAGKGMKSNGLSSSIMETPPKNVLENITVSHSNSNRKLFSSQSSNPDFKFVEDSNFVPASPNSKSYRCGTPVLKLKKLTDEEISRYSPSRKNLVDSDSQLVSGMGMSEHADKSKRVIDLGNVASADNSKQDHDDFSAFTPLEKGSKDLRDDSFYCSQPSSAEQAMVNLNDKVDADKVSEYSGSENLFSQCENLNDKSEKDTSLQNVSDDKNSPQPPTLDPYDFEAMDTREEDINMTKDQKVSKEEVSSVNSGREEVSPCSMPTDEPVKPGRGRKRKQITPKKLTPEDIKNKRKKEEDEDQVVVRKVRKRTKEKKDSESNSCDKSKLIKNNKNSSKSENSQGKGPRRKRSPRGGKRINSSSPSSASSAESSHEELEGSVLEDILDLEEDQICVKTLTEIKKDLKKNKKKVDKVIKGDKDLSKKSTKLKADIASKEVKDKEKVEVNPEVTKPTAAVNVAIVENKSSQKGVNDNVRLNGYNPQCEDISECESDIPQYGVDKNVLNNNNNIAYSSKGYQTIVAGSEPDHVDGKTNDPLNLEMEEGADFIAVKLSDNGLPQRIECKTDGTQQSPRGDHAVATVIESSDEEKDLPDIEKRYYDESESPFDNDVEDENNAGDSKEKNDTSLNDDDDIPISKMITKAVQENHKKSGIKNLANKASKRKVEPAKTKSKTTDETLGNSAVKRKQRVNTGKKIGIADKTVNGKKVAEAVDDNTEDGKAEEVDDAGDREGMQQGVVQAVEEGSEGNVEKLGQNDNKLEEVVDNKSYGDNKNYVDETPKKEADIMTSNVAARLMMRNSDSKLVVGSRKLEKKGGVARRSILKQASEDSSDVTQSPRRTPFHSITVGRIYSPTASPSASILKKRRLDAQSPSETCSPPTKVS